MSAVHTAQETAPVGFRPAGYLVEYEYDVFGYLYSASGYVIHKMRDTLRVEHNEDGDWVVRYAGNRSGYVLDTYLRKEAFDALKDVRLFLDNLLPELEKKAKRDKRKHFARIKARELYDADLDAWYAEQFKRIKMVPLRQLRSDTKPAAVVSGYQKGKRRADYHSHDLTTDFKVRKISSKSYDYEEGKDLYRVNYGHARHVSAFMQDRYVDSFGMDDMVPVIPTFSRPMPEYRA